MSVAAANAAATAVRRAAGDVRDRRQRQRREHRSERDVFRHPDGQRKERQGRHHGGGRQDREDAAGGGDALAAAKAEPHRVDVADDRRQTGGRRRRRLVAHVLGERHAQRAFRDVEQPPRVSRPSRPTRGTRWPRRDCRCRSCADRAHPIGAPAAARTARIRWRTPRRMTRAIKKIVEADPRNRPTARGRRVREPGVHARAACRRDPPASGGCGSATRRGPRSSRHRASNQPRPGRCRSDRRDVRQRASVRCG